MAWGPHQASKVEPEVQGVLVLETSALGTKREAALFVAAVAAENQVGIPVVVRPTRLGLEMVVEVLGTVVVLEALDHPAQAVQTEDLHAPDQNLEAAVLG